MNQFYTKVDPKEFIQSVDNKLRELEIYFLMSRDAEINKRLNSFSNRFLLIRNKYQITTLVYEEIVQAGRGRKVSTAIRHINNFKSKYRKPYLDLKYNLQLAINSNKADVLITSNELNFIKQYANGSKHMHILEKAHNPDNKVHDMDTL